MQVGSGGHAVNPISLTLTAPMPATITWNQVLRYTGIVSPTMPVTLIAEARFVGYGAETCAPARAVYMRWQTYPV